MQTIHRCDAKRRTRGPPAVSAPSVRYISGVCDVLNKNLRMHSSGPMGVLAYVIAWHILIQQRSSKCIIAIELKPPISVDVVVASCSSSSVSSAVGSKIILCWCGRCISSLTTLGHSLCNGNDSRRYTASDALSNRPARCASISSTHTAVWSGALNVYLYTYLKQRKWAQTCCTYYC